jgi:hypothetical protein
LVQLMNVKDGIALTGVEKIISFFPEESVQTQEKWRSAFREMLNLVPTSHLKNVYVYPCYDDNGEIETLQYVGLHDDMEEIFIVDWVDSLGMSIAPDVCNDMRTLEKVVAFCFFEMTWMGMSTSEIRQKRKEIMENSVGENNDMHISPNDLMY